MKIRLPFPLVYRVGCLLLCASVCLIGCRKSAPQKDSAGKSQPDRAAETAAKKPPSAPKPPKTPPVATPAHQRELASASVPVKLTVQHTVGEDRRVVVSGTSNLPTGTKLSVLVTPVITTPFRTQYKSLPVIRPDGTFASEPLGNAEVGMLPYKYDIVTQVLELSKQPDEVRAHFQDQPANLHGPLLVQAGQSERIEVIVPLELREYDPNMPLPERRQLHAAHVERYLTELKSLHALLKEKQKILEERSFDSTVNYNWPAIKSRLDALRRDRRMAGEFSELNQPFRHAEQQLEYYQQVLETKQGQFWDSARAQFEQVLSEAEQGLRNFQALP